MARKSGRGNSEDEVDITLPFDRGKKKQRNTATYKPKHQPKGKNPGVWGSGKGREKVEGDETSKKKQRDFPVGKRPRGAERKDPGLS